SVWNCGKNKSPGPDEYTFEFFRRYWRFVGPDFCFAAECFFDNGSFLMGSNSSIIALIPKVMDAKFVTEFRPISLIGCVYKVITKILANRLATVISDLVSDTQSAFVANRQILDGPFILNKLLAWCKGKKKQAMIFKVDVAKAYDSVRWDYLLDVLHAFGFGPNRCRWIRGTFSSTMASILVNGSPSSEFLFFCGLKQGDPLAPFLFILSIVTILKCFFFASGLKINIPKSQVLGIGVPRTLVTQAASLIGCALMQRPFRYLGVMIGDCISRKHAWDETIQKLHARLSNWKVHSFELHAAGYSSLWSSILREMHVLKSKGFDFVSHCKKRVGDGHNSRLWYDKWLSDQPFYVMFPRQFALEIDKEISVASKLGSTSLEVSFRRPVRDGVERQQLIDLNLLTSSILLSSSKDRWICDLSGDCEFRVKVARTKLDDVSPPSDSIDTRWVKYIPIKINVFAWRVRLDHLPTRVNLFRRGVFLESSLCPMCGYVVGGNWIGMTYFLSLIGMLGSLLFACRLVSSSFRKVFFTQLGGISGLTGIKLFSQKTLKDVL
nr:RNA-directed DNA polymerase, eukaryota [Tanacetum cinerariifolium]